MVNSLARTASRCNSFKHESSLLDWLEAKDRLIAGDVQEPEYIEEEEIPELMAVEDVTYDIEDEDDLIYKSSHSNCKLSHLLTGHSISLEPVCSFTGCAKLTALISDGIANRLPGRGIS